MRKTSFVVWIVLLALLLNACVPQAAPAPAATSAALTVTGADGKAFTLSQPAQRIISLAPSNTEILFALGAGSQIIAREDFSNFPEEAASLPSIGGNMGEYNLEEIARLEPDLILASPLTSPDALQALMEITPSVFVLPNPTSLDGLYQNLQTVGTLTGRTAEAQALVMDFTARALAVEQRLAGVTEKPLVFYELDATDPAKPWTAGKGTFIDLLIGLAGGQNLGSALQGEWAQISQEELIVKNPDVILLGDALYGGITAESVAARPGWESIAAVANGQVFPFNDDLVSRPGPRMIEGLEALARLLHPQLFP